MVLTRRAAEAGLASLLGMALDYAPWLDRHDTRRKVGVITRAEIVGKTAGAGRTFIRQGFSGDCAGDRRSEPALDASGSGIARGLGMSYEITDARVADAEPACGR